MKKFNPFDISIPDNYKMLASNAARTARLIQMGAPIQFIRHDTDLLIRRVYGSRKKAVWTIMGFWWGSCRFNPVYQFKKFKWNLLDAVSMTEFDQWEADNFVEHCKDIIKKGDKK